MAKIEIKRWDTNEIVICGEYESIKDALVKNPSKGFRAYLQGAYLQGADLQGADLRGADRHYFLPDLYLLKMQDCKLKAWKYLVNGKSPYQHAKYEVGKKYKFDDIDTDENECCGKGGNVATLQWCLRDSDKADEFIEVEFDSKDVVIPIMTDGKFRVKSFKVLRQINRKQAIALLK